MPDEDEGTQTLVAEPPATEEKDAVPASEQEQDEATEEVTPDSETQETEDEAPELDADDQTIVAIAEHAKANPGFAEKLKQFGDPSSGLDQRAAELDARESQAQVQTQAQTRDATYAETVTQLDAQVKTWATTQTGSVATEAKRLRDNGEAGDNVDLLDGEKLGNTMATALQLARKSAQDYGIQTTGNAVYEGMYQVLPRGSLTEEERGSLDSATSWKEFFSVFSDAAQRKAPAAKETARSKVADKEEENSKRLEKILGTLKNGQSVTQGASATKGGTKEPKTIEEVNAALMDPATPRDKLPGLQAKRNKLLGRE